MIKIYTDMEDSPTKVALGKRMRWLPNVPCYGVVPSWNGYPREIQGKLRLSQKVFYPTRLYEDLFISLGKHVFPRNYYRLMGHKIRQTELFQLLGIPHPRTRIYYGHNRKEKILRDFTLPYIAKDPVGSSQGRGVWLIRDEADLDHYLERCYPAYIQEYLSIDRDLRVVVVAGKIIHAYWRIGRQGEFRNNISQGARISCESLPKEALEFALDVAQRCRFDEVGLDICYFQGRYYVLEANMVYGMEGFRLVGLEFKKILIELAKGGYL